MNNFKYIFFIIFFITSCTPEYEERGFESEQQFLRATEAGFVEPVIYELALSKGFEDYKTYKSAIDRGFEDNDEFILANKYNLKNKSQLKKFLIDNLCTDTKSFGNICLNIPYEMSFSYPSLSSDGSIWWTSVYGQSEKIFKTSSGTYYDDATDVLKEYELAKIEKNIENADFDLSLICYDKYSGPADYGNRIIDTKSISPRIRIYKLNSILIFRSKNLISKKHLLSLPHAYSQFNEKYYRDKYNESKNLFATSRQVIPDELNGRDGGFVIVTGTTHANSYIGNERIIELKTENLFTGSLSAYDDGVNSFYNFSSKYFQLEINRKSAEGKIVKSGGWTWASNNTQAAIEMKRPQTCQEYPIEKLRAQIKTYIIDSAEMAYDKYHKSFVAKKEAEEKRKAELKKLKETENKI